MGSIEWHPIAAARAAGTVSTRANRSGDRQFHFDSLKKKLGGHLALKFT